MAVATVPHQVVCLSFHRQRRRLSASHREWVEEGRQHTWELAANGCGRVDKVVASSERPDAAFTHSSIRDGRTCVQHDRLVNSAPLVSERWMQHFRRRSPKPCDFARERQVIKMRFNLTEVDLAVCGVQHAPAVTMRRDTG